MEKPVFSLIAAAIRGDSAYSRFYDSVKSSNVPFEVVFVGPNPPKKDMPENFRYITTNVKVPQCFEIAARNSKGEYIIDATDDLVYSEKYLEKVLFFSQRFDMDRTVFLLRHNTGGTTFEFTTLFGVDNDPVMAAVFMIKKSIWHEIGGIDRRYQTTFWDTDLQYRCYERGMSPYTVPEVLATEWDNSRNTAGIIRLIKRSPFIGTMSGTDITARFWLKDNLFSNKRLYPVQPFTDDTILIENQEGSF